MAEKTTGVRTGRDALQEAQRQRTRTLIIEAAAQVFFERGYLNTSVEHVLARAGVSRAAFYAHFDGKLSLVCAIAEDFVPTWRPIFDHLAALEDPSVAELEAWAALHLALHRENRAVCGLLTQVAALEERLYWQLSEQRDSLIALLAARHSAFAVALINQQARLRARLLLWQIDQLCFLVVNERLPDPQHQAARLIAQQMMAFITGNPDGG